MPTKYSPFDNSLRKRTSASLDVRRVFLPAMRHRVILNFEAQAEGVDTDHVLTEILKKAPEKGDEKAA
jgi:MoxR-like ATPase